MKHRKILIAVVLIAIVIVSFFVASNLLAPGKQTAESSKPFYVGVETGWNSTVAQCESLIDKVKNYTNLYIIASPQVIKNETSLNQVCDYAYSAGMYFMPEFYQQFFVNPNGYTPHDWFVEAKTRYGNRLLGVYYYDEPAGTQLDTTQIIENPVLTPTSPAKSYLDYTNYFFWLWTHGSDGGLTVTSSFFNNANSSLFTSDYGLYWFDYELGYNSVLAQFGWNDSRPMQISLVRGAATAQNQTWGAIVTWTYNGTTNGGTYLEPPDQMYSDLVLAYDSGASYVAIYDSTQNYVNTTLTNPGYFTKLQDFWNYVHQNPNKQGSLKADTAVVLPQDYGFGFRSPTDSVWQYHTATSWTQQLYFNITNLLNKDTTKLDIVYSDTQFQSTIKTKYNTVLFWPQDFDKGVSYSVTDLNDSLGYNAIQDALSSFATFEGHMVMVKLGTYRENVAVTKPVTLTTENKNATIIESMMNGTALTIEADNVTVSGFTLKNAAIPSLTAGIGLMLENSHNCSVTNNIIADDYVGILLVNSSYNVFRSNEISSNIYNLILQNSEPNSIEVSNIVEGKPYSVG